MLASTVLRAGATDRIVVVPREELRTGKAHVDAYVKLPPSNRFELVAQKHVKQWLAIATEQRSK